MSTQRATEPNGSEINDDELAQFCARLQPLPSVLRYYDEFDDTTRSIRSPTEENVFEIISHGRSSRINFEKRNPYCALILKHTLALMFEQNLSIRTVAGYFSNLPHLLDHDLVALLRASPLEIGRLWAELRARELGAGSYILAKHILHLLCTYRWNGWSDEYRTFLRVTLPLPAVDKYAAVRAGDVFLSADEEAAIVRHLMRG